MENNITNEEFETEVNEVNSFEEVDDFDDFSEVDNSTKIAAFAGGVAIATGVIVGTQQLYKHVGKPFGNKVVKPIYAKAKNAVSQWRNKSKKSETENETVTLMADEIDEALELAQENYIK